MKLTAKLSGTGNVFDESQFMKSTATRFKKELAERMTARMKELKLTLQDSAKKAKCEIDDIRDIRKANVAQFEIAELVSLARCFGFGVNVKISVPEMIGPKLH